MLPKIVAIVGPTASGKTALGEALALHFGGEVISADSKQVFRGMDIGTAKELYLKVPQHLIDIKNPGEKISVAEYQGLAYREIDVLLSQGKLPFLVGGSMLYVDAVLEGYVFGGSGNQVKNPKYTPLRIGIEWDREELRAHAIERLHKRINQGLQAEVEGLLAGGISREWLWQCGIEYRFMSLFILGEITHEEMLFRMEVATNNYIKRQYTWWRHHGDVNWLPDVESATALVEGFLSGSDVV